MKLNFFKLAKRASKKSNHHTHHIGAVIVKGNRIVSIGYNQLKTHPKSYHDWGYLHAETKALLDAPRHLLRGSTIYLYRETKTGEALSKPCWYCERMLKDYGVTTVYFTANKNEYGILDLR